MELSEVAVFVKVVQAGSFTQAARLLDAPKSTVSAKVAGLERRLGVTLLHRTTRKLRVTDEGETFFRTCARALADIEAAESLLASSQQTPHGRIAVTAPVNMGGLLAEFLPNFLDEYQGIRVDLVLTNRYVDLVGENIDVAIRGGVLRDSSLVAKRLGGTPSELYASPAYLQKHKAIESPKDLEAHQCLRFGGKDEWELSRNGRPVTVKIDGRVSADDLPTLRELAIHGLGIALLPRFFCLPDQEEGKLQRVLPDWQHDVAPVSLVYPPQKFQHPKVRVFVEACALAIQKAYHL